MFFVMISCHTGPPYTQLFLGSFLDFSIPEIKYFFLRLTPEWMCFIHFKIYRVLKSPPIDILKCTHKMG